MMMLIPVSAYTNITFNFVELITIMSFFGGLVTVWIAFRIKVAKIEVQIVSLKCEFQLQLKAIESKSIGLSDFMGARLKEFVDDNKDDHNEIKDSIKGIVGSIKVINDKVIQISITKKTTR